MSSTSRSAISEPKSPDVWANSIEQQLRNQFAKGVTNATLSELFRATASALRPGIVDNLLESASRFRSANAKSVHYLSMEFLLGRSLGNNLQNLGLYRLMDE